jgi:all-trans-8'-apo-beta-carotenal 15,15'-oxygenase
MSEPAVASVAASAVDYAPGLERAFSFLPREGSYRVRRIEGRVPEFLRGTYLLNGPARFKRGGLRYRHWLDGDGMVCALRFGSDGVRFTNRFVRSAKWVAEEAAGQPLYRTFGTGFAGDQLLRGVALASPVNVSVFPWHGTLLAFGEQGRPWELDPETLETRGEYSFGDRLNPVAPFSAHPKIDPATGELLNFGVSFAAAQPVLNLYRFTPAGELVYRRRLPLDYPCSLHDFALSHRHAVFYLSPYLLDMQRFLQGGSTLMDCLSWEPERGSRLLVASRETGEPVAALPVGQGYCLHLINAFEEGDRLTVDVLELERPVYDQYQEVPDLFTDVGPGGPVRFVIDLAGPRLVERRQIGYRQAPDFPALDLRLMERSYHEFWMLGISAAGNPGRKFFDQLVHCDWSAEAVGGVWQAPPQQYLGGEPAYAPDLSGREAGAVICQVFDAERGESAFAVFNAEDVAAGPQALLWLDSPVPLLFHALFDPAPEE